MFARYLVYGGVEVGPKLFGGVTERELQEMDKENVYHARSQTDIGIDKLKLAIDFDLVVKGFLWVPEPYPSWIRFTGTNGRTDSC